ncbi:(R)-amidase [Paraburkholderia sp. GAS448]|uniref:carbon-nitrogen hydrolase family protein n=1 Tax=Paraburkholderia sp. GAS448 TaxID=3035136 RepID=UPI003D1CB2AD
MKSPRIRLIQSTVVDGDIAGNLNKALKIIAECAGEVDLVVFSETFIPGFPTPENVSRLAEPVDGPSITAIRTAAKDTGLSVAIGFAEVDNGRFFNTGVLIDASGEILHRYRKSHLYASDEGVFEAGVEFPVCDWHGIRLGLLICFDIEFPETARMLAHNGADLIVVLDGMMKPYGHVHRAAIPVRAMENQLYMVMANRVGAGDHYTFSGESHVANPFGQTVSIAGADDVTAINVTLDMDDVRRAREEFRYVELSTIPLADVRRP